LFQGKRGIEKQPFQLPDFIAATGIEKIRQVNLVPVSQQFTSLSAQFLPS
jgi:splicing factor 3B subunit 2